MDTKQFGAQNLRPTEHSSTTEYLTIIENHNDSEDQNMLQKII